MEDYFAGHNLDINNMQKEPTAKLAANPFAVKRNQTAVTIPVSTINQLCEIAEDDSKLNWCLAKADLTASRNAVGNVLKGLHGRYTQLFDTLHFNADSQAIHVNHFPKLLLVKLIKIMIGLYGGGAGHW